MKGKDYYRILEIPRNAEKQDIKKAYFRLVRKYPPERRPRDFKKIREAYEVLIDDHTRKEYDSVNNLPKIVQLYFQDGKKALEEDDPERAIQLLEKVIRVYPDFTVVNSLLGDAYMQNGNSGKAVRIYEKLVSREPDNASFAGKLANACMERGFRKKAIETYETAISLDEDNLSYWDGLIECHIKAKEWEQVDETAQRAIDVSKRKEWDSLPIYMTLIQVDIMKQRWDELDARLNEMKEAARIYTDDKESMGWYLGRLARLLQEVGRNETAASLIDAAYTMSPEDEDVKQLYDDIRTENRYRRGIDKLRESPFYPDELADMLELQLEKNQDEDWEEIDEHNEFVMEANIVFDLIPSRKYVRKLKEEYPELYQLKAAFFNRVLNLVQTRRLEQEYEKKLKIMAKRFPDRFADEEEEEEEWYQTQEPIRREGPKIGRNDPCPCGSGKKYKKCCGRNL